MCDLATRQLIPSGLLGSPNQIYLFSFFVFLFLYQAENGLLEKQQANGVPYAWEEWQQYMRQKTLRSRRKRALCMGVIALSIILFVGVTVSVGLAYLRKKF